MKNSFTILVSILLSFSARTQTQTPVYLSQTITSAASKGFYRLLPKDYATTTKSYPLIIWVHGAGGIGQGTAAELPRVLEFGLPKVINAGGFVDSFRVSGVDYSFIVISPQFMNWPSAANITAMINYLSNNYRIDADRIYLMGLSAGGGGVWDYASASVANSDRVAAIIPFCGTTAPTQTLAGRIAASKLPVWAFHNTYDGTVPVAYSRNWVNYINSYIPTPTPAAKLTEFPIQSNDAVIAHDCSVQPIQSSYKPAPAGINIYEWLLQYKRRTTIVNASPVARAGNDTSVVLPATIRLDGSSSTDADGIISIYRWKKISGPLTFSIADSTAANTTVSNMAPGTYQFELTVTDNGGVKATDNITVNVYAAFAPGTLQRVLIDVGSGTLTTSPSMNGLYWNNMTDARAGVRVSNAITTLNLPSGINVQVINRLDGTFGTASTNALGTGNTTGIVGDYPASATTDFAMMHYSGSDGLWRISGLSPSKVYTIKFWGSRTGTTAARTAEIKRADETVWKSYTGTSNTNYDNAAVFLISGQTSMDFNIRTKSGSDYSALSVMDIRFGEESPPAPLPNKSPTANAGPDVTIQLPADSTLLNGCASTDTENAPLKFKWTKISGPDNFQIVNDTVCQARIRNLISGNYLFELSVSDTGNLVAKDTVAITVQPMSQPWPQVVQAICNDPYKIVILGSSTAYGSGATPIDSSWGRKLERYVSLQNNQSTVVNLGLPGYTSYHLLPTGTVPPESRNYPVDTTHNITKALQLKPKAIILNLPSNDIAMGITISEVKANFDLIVAKADSAKVPVWVTTTQPRNTLSPAEKSMQAELKTWILEHYGNKAVDFWTDIANADNTINALYSANDNVHVNNAGHHLFFTRIVAEKIWDSICLRKNNPPVANAGNDTLIIANSVSIQLNGSASHDPEGAALSYNWSIIYGTGGSFDNNNIVNPIFTSSLAGQYKIVLTVTDDDHLSDTDTLNINILAPNILPVAKAGDDIIHNLPPDSLQLHGTGTDEDGTIVKYKWRAISGTALSFVNDSIANPKIVSLVGGIYFLELTVTDERGGIAKDTMLLFVNTPPVAKAGADVFITGTSANIQLDGTASSSIPEGNTLNFEWSVIAGIGGTFDNSNIGNPVFTASSVGQYRIVLTVTDSNQLKDTDTLLVSILAPNILPIANAGQDIIHNLPPDSLQLHGTGTDEDGTIVKYKWRVTSGTAISFVNDSIANPKIVSLVSGIYFLELKVTDDRGGTAKDSMILIVNTQPVARAGADVFITGTSASIQLNGAASSDPEGDPLVYNWNIISGANGVLDNSNIVNPMFTSSSVGQYNIELRVTDNNQLTGKDTIHISIMPPNIFPIANAGQDIIHNLPPDSLQLLGTGTDEDGTIVKYKWRVVSGPALNFVKDSIANPMIVSLVSGIHFLELTVTDERGGTAKDTMQLIVNAPPVAKAGSDIFITANSANVQLNGAASSDPEGAPLKYNWNILSGTNGVLDNSNIVNPVFTSSSVGQFSIELTVTDDNQLTGKDTILISIIPPNILPIADAGQDILHTLPPNSLQLHGDGTDEDGTIIKYKWRVVSGPALNFVKDSVANPMIVSLVRGIYFLELTVTDERSGTAKDTMQLIVNAPPLAKAGSDIFITATSANLLLNGSASSDPEGAPLNYEWRIISGERAALNNISLATPSFITDTAGIYSIELKVTDEYLAFALDTMLIVIEKPNIPPVAYAGDDKLIHLPPNSTSLNGSTSFDSDGTIVAYKWRKISGPSMTFSNDTNANPSVNSLTYGVYSFELVVTDNKGATAKDTMVLTVNNPPVANAGPNASITLPANTVTLNGNGSTDIDGNIASYSWRLLNGLTANITSSSSAQTIVTFTTPNTYPFEITVTDNRGKASKDTVEISVLPAPTIITKNIKVNIFGGTNPYNNAQWNNWNLAGSLTSTRFNYDDGTVSNVTAGINESALIADNGTAYASTTTVCPPQVLRYTSANTSYRTLTFNGLITTKTYNLEFYASRANTGNSTTFKIGTKVDTINTDNNINDFVRFTNIVPDNNGRIIVTINRTGTWNYLSGFIVTEITALSQLMVSTQTATAQIAMVEKPVTESANLTVYPNPATNIINLNIPADVSGPYKVSVINMNGQTVLQKTGTKQNGVISDKIYLTELPKGIYLLKISIQNKILSNTIIKL